jgi:hypothetical protein
MSNKKILYETPVPSTEFLTEAVLCANMVRFSYRVNGSDRLSGLRFQGVKATRTRAESACTAGQIDGAYDTLVEIESSPWLDEVQAASADLQRRLGETWTMHHYMIYLDSAGCFEFLAASWEVLPEASGTSDAST